MGNAFLVEPYAPFTAGSGSGAVAPSSVNDLFNDYIGVQYTAAAGVGGSDYVEVDFAGTVPVDTVAFLSSSGSAPTWSVRAAMTQVGLAVPAYDSGVLTFAAGTVAPTSNRRNSLLVMPAVNNYQFWRVYANNPVTTFSAGRLVIGRRIQPLCNFSFGAAFGATDRGGGDFSAQGVWLPKPGIIQRTVGLTWSFVSKQEAEESIQPLLERFGNGKFILLVSDPAANALLERRMYFGPLVGTLDTVWRTANAFELRVNLVSVI